MNYRMIPLFLMVVLALGSLQAQERKPITLEEAINLSVANNKQLKVSAAKIEEANAAITEAEQRKLPDATVSGSYLRLTSAKVDVKTRNNNSGGTGGGTGGGGTGSGESPKVSQAVYGILNLSLPIYAGGRIRYGIESSKFLAQAVSLDAANDKDAVIQNTVEAYVNLFKAKAALDLVNENLAQSQQRVKDLSNLEKNGLLARNDLLKAELQVSNTELSLVELENSWQLANFNMNLMLGLPENTVLQPDSALLRRNLNVQPLESYWQAAVQNRKDLAALDLRKQAAETGVKATRAEYYPSIALTAGYIAADIPRVLTVTNAANVGVGVSYNIGSLWKTKAKIEGASARVRQLEATQAQANDGIRLEIKKAYLDWFSSQKRIEVFAKAIEQATENYRIVNNKYNNSLATTTDLLDADVAQLQAKLNHLLARADAVVVYNRLLQAAGENLSTN